MFDPHSYVSKWNIYGIRVKFKTNERNREISMLAFIVVTLAVIGLLAIWVQSMTDSMNSLGWINQQFNFWMSAATVVALGFIFRNFQIPVLFALQVLIWLF